MTALMGGGVTLPPFYNLHYFDSIGSTSVELRSQADSGAAEGTIIWSKQQNSGVGRRGRSWSSPAGNLYCSILLNPQKPAFEAAQLSFVAAVALHQAINGILPTEQTLTLKWPNDVLLNGHKLAGILLESKSSSDGVVDWVLIGSGVNVALYPANTDGLPAISLKSVGATVSVAGVLDAYATALLEWYFIWKDKGFAPIREAWLKNAHGLGDPIRVQMPSTTHFGIFSGLDQNGVLQLTKDDGTIMPISTGEIFAAPNTDQKPCC